MAEHISESIDFRYCYNGSVGCRLGTSDRAETDCFFNYKIDGWINLICWIYVNLTRVFFDSTKYFLTHNFLAINFPIVYYAQQCYQVQV